MPALNKRARFRAPFQDLPLDILPPIINQLTDRKDWHACALASKTFNRVATPLLYRTLDSRVISKVSKYHSLFSSPEMPIDSMVGICAARRTLLIKHALLADLDFSQVLLVMTLIVLTLPPSRS